MSKLNKMNGSSKNVPPMGAGQIRILNFLNHRLDQPATRAEISNGIGMPAGTVYTFLRTLKIERFVDCFQGDTRVEANSTGKTMRYGITQAGKVKMEQLDSQPSTGQNVMQVRADVRSLKQITTVAPSSVFDLARFS